MGFFGPPNIEKLKSKENISGLIKAAKNKNVLIRKKAIEALVTVDEIKAIDPLVEALKDEDQIVRETAIIALSNNKYFKDSEPLIVALKDKSPIVRKESVKLLGQIAEKKAIDPLVEALKDEDQIVRKNAIVALSQLGENKDSKIIDSLVISLDDKDVDVRLMSIQYLSHIDDNRVLESLILRLKNEYDRHVLRSIANTLENKGWKPKEDELGAIYYVATENWPQCIKIGRLATGPLMRRIRIIDELDEHTSDVIMTLAEIGDIQAVKTIAEALKHGTPKVFKQAVKAVNKFADEELIEPLSTGYENQKWKRSKKQQLSEETLKSILNAYIRIGSPKSIEALLELLNDRSEYKNVSRVYKELSPQFFVDIFRVCLANSKKEEMEKQLVKILTIVPQNKIPAVLNLILDTVKTVEFAYEHKVQALSVGLLFSVKENMALEDIDRFISLGANTNSCFVERKDVHVWDLDEWEDIYKTPLYYAIENKRVDLVKTLMAAGAKLDTKIVYSGDSYSSNSDYPETYQREGTFDILQFAYKTDPDIGKYLSNYLNSK